MPFCLIGLGSNLGHRQESLDQAVDHLARHPQMSLHATSRWHETQPVGGPTPQGLFLNGAALVETSLAPASVLEALRGIESALGRRRRERWGPRIIDLDLLLYDDRVVEEPSLVVPHPRMAWRRFVLEPAAEVAGAMVHPLIGWSVARLLEHLNTAPAYVAITGGIGAGKTQLAERLAQQRAAKLIAETPDLEQLEQFYADPASHGWAMEIEFLKQRAGLLAVDSPQWADRQQLVVSDFWFGQSRAFARVWLPSHRWEAYREQFDRLRSKVARPRLIVLLDASAQELRRRVLHRGRPCERELREEQLEQIRLEIAAEAARPDHGPLLKLADADPDRALEEVSAAVDAMG